MHVLIPSLALAAAFLAVPAHAAKGDPPPAAGTVQPVDPATRKERVRTCNEGAKGKSGDDRRAYLKACLSSKL